MSTYEPDSISVPSIRKVGFVTLSVLAVVAVLMLGWSSIYQPSGDTPDTHLADDYATYSKQSQARLHSSGPDHLSIDQAMDAVVREGIK